MKASRRGFLGFLSVAPLVKVALPEPMPRVNGPSVRCSSCSPVSGSQCVYGEAHGDLRHSWWSLECHSLLLDHWREGSKEDWVELWIDFNRMLWFNCSLERYPLPNPHTAYPFNWILVGERGVVRILNLDYNYAEATLLGADRSIHKLRWHPGAQMAGTMSVSLIAR